MKAFVSKDTQFSGLGGDRSMGGSADRDEKVLTFSGPAYQGIGAPDLFSDKIIRSQEYLIYFF